MTPEELAYKIAETIFYHNSEATHREKLRDLLLDFAREIKRSTIEE